MSILLSFGSGSGKLTTGDVVCLWTPLSTKLGETTLSSISRSHSPRVLSPMSSGWAAPQATTISNARQKNILIKFGHRSDSSHSVREGQRVTCDLLAELNQQKANMHNTKSRSPADQSQRTEDDHSPSHVRMLYNSGFVFKHYESPIACDVRLSQAF